LPDGSEFSHCRRPGAAPAPTPQSSSSPVAQSAAPGRWPEVSPSPVARGFLAPKARGLPLPGGSGSPQASDPRRPVAGGSGPPQARRPEVSRCRVAPDLSGPKARRCPLPGGSGLTPRRWRRVSSVPTAPGLPLRPRARGNPHCRWLQKALLPVARGPSFAGWLRGFPLCQWLRVSPSPATVPGGEEISTPVRTGRTRGLHQQFQDSLAVHKPSTVNPGLSPATDVSPPNTPQRGPQAGRIGELG
jgi:hypothetical protein